MHKSNALIASAIVISLISAQPASAQVNTEHEGWFTTRSSNGCVTLMKSSETYDLGSLLLTYDGRNLIAAAGLNPKKYPLLASSIGKRMTLPAAISGKGGYFKRRPVSFAVTESRGHLVLIFDQGLIDDLIPATSLSLRMDGEFFPIVLQFTNIPSGMADLRACEDILTGQLSASAQPKDAPLSSLPPYERAAAECQNELEQTLGAVAADNPYVYEGKRYPNACSALEAATKERLSKVRPLAD